jgi:hypothetical protein
VAFAQAQAQTLAKNAVRQGLETIETAKALLFLAPKRSA